MKTTERLAQTLDGAGLFELARRAREGCYDEYESQSATPIVDLVTALRAAGRDDLAPRARAGEWDSTGEEADAWAESADGQRVLNRAAKRRWPGRDTEWP